MQAILRNAGVDAPSIVHEAQSRAARGVPARVFNVVSRVWVDPWSVGLVDPLPVTVAALETSVRTACVALTSEVLVRRKDPPMVVEP